MADAVELLQQIADGIAGLPAQLADLMVREPPQQRTATPGLGGPGSGPSPPPPGLVPHGDAVQNLGAALGYSGLGVNQQLGLIRGAQQSQEDLSKRLERDEEQKAPPAPSAPAGKGEAVPAPSESGAGAADGGGGKGPRPVAVPASFPSLPEYAPPADEEAERPTRLDFDSSPDVPAKPQAPPPPPPPPPLPPSEGGSMRDSSGGWTPSGPLPPPPPAPAHDASTPRGVTTPHTPGEPVAPATRPEAVPQAGGAEGQGTGSLAQDIKDLKDAVEKNTETLEETRKAYAENRGEGGRGGIHPFGPVKEPADAPEPPKKSGVHPSVKAPWE